MTDFLGIPITIIMIVLLVLLAVSLIAVAAVWARNPILFSIGLRNIPRRKAQSVLIVLGLMLSTVIVSAAFSVGDTVNYSITNDSYNKLGHVDEIVQVRANETAPSLTEEQIAAPGVVPQQISDGIITDFNGSPDVDGVMPGLRFAAPVKNRDANRAEPQVVIMGLDPRHTEGFEEDIVAPNGQMYPLVQLKPNEALANTSTQQALSLRLGDRIDVFVNRTPRNLTIVGFVQDKYLTGWTQGAPNGLVVTLPTAQLLHGTKSGAGFVAISNTGGVRDSLGNAATVRSSLIKSIRSSLYQVTSIKQDRIDRAQELGSNMSAIFVVLGLFSIAAGLLLVFLILVMLAAERRPEMGMSRAVGMKRQQLIESFMAEGMAYSVTSALVGAVLGVIVSIVMTRAMTYIFNRFDVAIVFHVTLRSLVVAYCLGVVLTFVTVVLSSWRVSKLSIVAAIRELNEPAPRATGVWTGVAGAVFVIGGIALTVFGLYGDRAWAFGTGVSLILIGGASVARAFGARERPAFTATSVAVIVLWVLVAGDHLRRITGPLNPGLETFFVGGVLMVAAATFIVIYNADLLLGSLRAVGLVFARAVPAVRTSIAYPLANKFRTGMTIAMLSLVVFALVMISTMSLNFRRLFLSPDSRGGWDIEVAALPINAFSGDAHGNRLGPLGEALDRAFYDTSKIDTLSQVMVANPRTTQISELDAFNKGEPGKPFKVLGADDAFLAENTIGLQARAEGYATDREAWDAVKASGDNAIIDGSVVPGINYANLTETRFTLSDYKSGVRTFAPFAMMIQDTARGKRKPVHIIGIMNRGPSETYAGMWINSAAEQTTFPPLFSRYYVRLKPGLDARAEAANIETALAENGVSAVSIQRQVEKSQALSTAFFYLIQGFMALGLGVGLAALGVIAFRTVVERRQQIGLMRAIGFSRASVALMFILESAFIAVLGIVNGIWLALLLASQLLQSDAFSTAGFTSFYVPWLQIVLMAVAVFVASVLTTLIPSRQASSIPIAEALRYE